MKIIDRYLLRSLLVPLAYCFTAFTMVYIVFDLFNNLGDFVNGKAAAAEIAQFYLMLIPCSLIYIVPVSLMLAVLYSLATLTKNNELTAMRSCGVSLLRLMAPYLAVGFIASLLVTVANETVGPYSAYWTKLFIRAQKYENKMDVYVAKLLAMRNDRERRTWMITEYNTLTCEMKGIEVIQHRPDGMDQTKYFASSGRWLSGRWWFRDVTIQNYDDYGFPRGAPSREPTREMSELTETPEDFLKEVKNPDFVKGDNILSASELLGYIERHRTLSRETIRRILVDFHSRLAMPWAAMISTLIGIPIGTLTGRRGAFRGILTCLILFFSFWVLISLGLWLGKNGWLPPLLAGWMPVGLFIGGGGVFATRLR